MNKMAWYIRDIGRDIDDCGGCIYLESNDQYEYCTYKAEYLENCGRKCTCKKIIGGGSKSFSFFI
jgi:hypothetical protein